jgi:hypothetical protein
MYDRRNGNRHEVDMPVTKLTGDNARDGYAADLGPTGVRLRRVLDRAPTQPLLNIELHLVPGAISTVIAARKVWHDDDYEGFEFIAPSFAQQAFLERACGNF